MLYYNSCHSVLEWDEVQLLTELGYDVFANGCYNDPKGHYTLPRPEIKGAIFHEDLFNISRRYPKTKLPKEFIDRFDTLIFMSGENEEVLISNWDNIKHKRVIWRTIGQCTTSTENRMQELRKQGLQIIRMSPKEKLYPNFCGEDTIIRFYKDENIYKDWNGKEARVINFTQSLKARRSFCHYDEIIGSILDFDGLVYGSGNNDLGVLNGGEVSFERQIQLYRDSRVYIYAGSWPSPYTLSFIEAFMTGIPVIAFSKNITQNHEGLSFYEVDEIINNGINGFIVNSIPEARYIIDILLKDHEKAKIISNNARKKAIELFSKEIAKKQWKEFLK